MFTPSPPPNFLLSFIRRFSFLKDLFLVHVAHKTRDDTSLFLNFVYPTSTEQHMLKTAFAPTFINNQCNRKNNNNNNSARAVNSAQFSFLMRWLVGCCVLLINWNDMVIKSNGDNLATYVRVLYCRTKTCQNYISEAWCGSSFQNWSV